MNKISEWLETYAGYADKPESEVTMQYSKDVDRLVKDAEALFPICEGKGLVVPIEFHPAMERLHNALKPFRESEATNAKPT